MTEAKPKLEGPIITETLVAFRNQMSRIVSLCLSSWAPSQNSYWRASKVVPISGIFHNDDGSTNIYHSYGTAITLKVDPLMSATATHIVYLDKDEKPILWQELSSEIGTDGVAIIKDPKNIKPFA